MLTGEKRANVISGGDGNDIIRGMAGADTLTGGAGKDTFLFAKKDFADGTSDHVTDFQKGTDMLDLSHVAKPKDAAGVAQIVFTDKADGTHVSFHGHEVVVLDHVHVTIAGLQSAGSLIL